jgi:hypothetical protein
MELWIQPVSGHYSAITPYVKPSHILLLYIHMWYLVYTHVVPCIYYVVPCIYTCDTLYIHMWYPVFTHVVPCMCTCGIRKSPEVIACTCATGSCITGNDFTGTRNEREIISHVFNLYFPRCFFPELLYILGTNNHFRWLPVTSLLHTTPPQM